MTLVLRYIEHSLANGFNRTSALLKIFSVLPAFVKFDLLQTLWWNIWLRRAGKRKGFCWILQDFEGEGVAVEENGWRHWKEEQKLGGGAHQGRRGWSKTTGVMDL
ncbi:hypothetical protein BY996DRAFT_8392341 [Phakopsora pachyrhizi]|nr:hypothetical protein BY996DRAFT_8392341 [Phakopsora pachyrhizi]